MIGEFLISYITLYIYNILITHMTTMEYSIILSRDHILIESVDGILLIDTGSPLSFHENGLIHLGDE